MATLLFRPRQAAFASQPPKDPSTNQIPPSLPTRPTNDEPKINMLILQQDPVVSIQEICPPLPARPSENTQNIELIVHSKPEVIDPKEVPKPRYIHPTLNLSKEELLKLRAIRDTSSLTIGKHYLLGRVKQGDALRHARSEAVLVLATELELEKMFNSLVSKLTADFVGSTVMGLAAFIEAPLVLSASINIGKGIHHIHELVKLLQEFKKRGLKPPKGKIPARISLGLFLKLGIITITLGQGDFLADMDAISGLHELIVHIFEPSEWMSGDSWSNTLGEAAQAHANFLADHPTISKVINVFEWPLQTFEHVFGPQTAAVVENTYESGALGIPDWTWAEVSDGDFTAGEIIGANVAALVGDQGVQLVLEDPADQAVEKIENRAEKKELHNV